MSFGYLKFFLLRFNEENDLAFSMSFPHKKTNIDRKEHTPSLLFKNENFVINILKRSLYEASPLGFVSKSLEESTTYFFQYTTFGLLKLR